MIKRICELTEADKKSYLENVKREIETSLGAPWKVYEEKMLADLDAAFDDEKFCKMDPEFAVDAAYLRRDFKMKKPSLVDYLLWMGQFVTKSNLVEINQCLARKVAKGG